MVSDEGFSGSSTDPYCGGTILNKKTILSAAHCFGNLTNQITLFDQRAYISAGILHFKDAVRTSVFKKFVQHIDVKNIDLHPQYSTIKHPGTGAITHNFDAAIVRLHESLKFDNHVTPACLPDPDFKSEVAIISGWGNKKITEGKDYMYQLLNLVIQIRCRFITNVLNFTSLIFPRESKYTANIYRMVIGNFIGNPLSA